MIIPVKKARVVVLNDDLKKALKIIQKKRLLMLIEEQSSEKEDTNKIDTLIREVDEAINFLELFMPKKGFFYYKEINQNVFDNHNDKVNDYLKYILDKKVLNEQFKNKIKEFKEEINNNLPFKEMPLKINLMSKTEYVNFYVGFIHESILEELKLFFEKNEIIYELYGKDDRGQALSFVLLKEQELLLNDINEFDFKKFTLPNSDEVMNDYLNLLEDELKDYQTTLKNNEESIKEASKEIDLLYVYADQLRTDKRIKEAPVIKTKETTILSGWIREDKTDLLDKILNQNLKFYEVEYLEPAPNEIVPTAIQNNKFVENFETITDSYNIPNHKEIDPNPLMSIWYFLIFGLMMGDIGYGLVMVIAFGLFLKLKKPKGGFKQLVSVFYYSGYMTIIAGILFGSLFGVDFDIGNIIGNIFNQNWSSTVLVPMEDPLTMLIVSIGIGILHIISGLVMKVMLSIKLKEPLAAISDGVSWILILVGVVFLALSMVSDLPNIIGIVLMAIGAILIFFLAGGKEKNIFKRIISGLGGLYGVSGYLSDVLSYSRILALSLSSAVIAFTFNLLAGMLQTGIIGFVISLVIYLIGHLFNFAMGLLSAYIHDSRLQYIEFFNKFYIGEGVKFEPLQIELKYIDELVM